jgi:RimJ/RimL family protein N-acetyltransferase
MSFDLSDPSKQLGDKPLLLRWMPGFYRAPTGECLVDWTSSWLRNIKTYLGFQGQGFAKKMLGDLIKLAKLKRVDKLWGMMAIENVIAGKLFEGMGFKAEQIGQSGIKRVVLEFRGE